jgi:hypothetical protein
VRALLGVRRLWLSGVVIFVLIPCDQHICVISRR